jgi:hypothetical protein
MAKRIRYGSLALVGLLVGGCSLVLGLDKNYHPAGNGGGGASSSSTSSGLGGNAHAASSSGLGGSTAHAASSSGIGNGGNGPAAGSSSSGIGSGGPAASSSSSGAGGCDGGTSATTGTGGAPLGCPASVVPPNATIATFLDDAGVSDYGLIVTYPTGATAPTYSNSSGGLVISENVAGTADVQYAGLVVPFFGDACRTDCVDAHGYTGVQFDISGTAACYEVQFAINDSEHSDPMNGDPQRGTGPKGSYSPQLVLNSAQITSATQTMRVPFVGVGAPTNGSPGTPIDPAKLISVQWQFVVATGQSCVASLNIKNLRFY